jgi:hypothetical protein
VLAWALVSLGLGACVRVPPRASEPAAPTSTPELDAWNAEAHAMLTDSLDALRTFDVFAAYRVSSAAESSLRSAAALAWDPPTAAAWDEAVHVSRGLHGRADQLFQAVTTGRIDPSLWREQRTLAAATRDLFDLGDALLAYHDRIQVLPPGDASGALSLLDRGWSLWESVAGRFGLSRAEPVACGG